MKIGKKFRVTMNKLLAVALVGGTVLGSMSTVMAAGGDSGSLTRSITITNQFSKDGVKEGITGSKYLIRPYKVTKADGTESREAADFKKVLDSVTGDDKIKVDKTKGEISVDMTGLTTKKVNLYTRGADNLEYAFSVEQTEAVPGFTKNTELAKTRVDFPTKDGSGNHTLRVEDVKIYVKNALQVDQSAAGGKVEFGFSKKSNAGLSVEGTGLKLVRVTRDNNELDKNFNLYQGTSKEKPFETEALADSKGEVIFKNVSPGVYDIVESQGDKKGNHFLKKGTLGQIKVDNDLVGTFITKGEFKQAEGNETISVNSTSLTNTAKPRPDADTTKDGAFNKALYKVNGTEVKGEAPKNLRRGDKVEWKITINIPDNIKILKSFGFRDKPGTALDFDGKNAKDVITGDNLDLFNVAFKDGNPKELKVMMKDPAKCEEIGVLTFVVKTVVKDTAALDEVVNNVVGIVFDDGNGATSGYKDNNGTETDTTPDANDDNTIVDNTDKKDGTSPKVSTDNQLLIKTDKTPSKISIKPKDGDGKEIKPEDNNKNPRPVNNLPDGTYIVEITGSTGSDSEGNRPVKPEFEVVIENNQVKTIDGKPVMDGEKPLDKDGFKWDNKKNEVTVKMVDADTWTPGTGTMTVLPILGLAGAAAAVGKALKKREDNNNNDNNGNIEE